MGTLTLGQAAAWCGGSVEPRYRDVPFFGAGNDSRHIREGELFIALQGARDGFDFIPDAMTRGAAGVLCNRPAENIPAIVVPDPRIALGDIARMERQRLGVKVVGITGSVGKSTTKEMVAAVLGTTWRTGKSPVNHNNDIGLPMSILALAEDTEVAVLEMGMNHSREMAYLTTIAQPDVAVITNIGTMHIEHLGSIEGILRAKLEILEGMKEEGTLILNGDDRLLWNLRDQQKQHTVYFGEGNQDCWVQALDVAEAPGVLSFRVHCDGLNFPVEMALDGRHYVPDALAAATVGLELGVDPGKIQESLCQFRNMAGRQEIYEAKGCTIIQDYYNAGPESMAAALNVLGNRTGRRVAVLGDMLELGVCTQAEHYRIGRIAAEKADLILAYGPNSTRIVSGAITGGVSSANVRGFEDPEALVRTLKRIARPGDVILFKGSRGMHLEKILEQFLDDET